MDSRDNLYADIEYARLSDPLVRFRTDKQKVNLTVSEDGRYYATLTLDGLDETTVYMARVQFYRRTLLLQPGAAVAVLIDPMTRRETWRLGRLPVMSEPDLQVEQRIIFPFPDGPLDLRRPRPQLAPRGPGAMQPRQGPRMRPGWFGPRAPRMTRRQEKFVDQVREAAPWRLRARPMPRRIVRPETRISYEPLGDPSDWYYDTTTGPKEKSVVRTNIVHKALAQFGDSEAGRVGILGYQRINGERYCGNDYDYWCSEFYAWCAKNWLSGISSASCVDDLVEYFAAAYYAEAQVTQADRGDYVSFGTYHSGMFLALDRRGSNNPGDWYIWTCEGNTSDSRRFNDTGTYMTHVPGNTVQVLYRPMTDAALGFGHILYEHLR